MPRSFEFPLLSGHLNQSELWVPLSLTPAELTTGAGYWGYRMVGRLKSGITVVQAQADAEHVTGEIMRNYPSRLAAIHIDAIVRPLQEDTVDSARSLVNLLFLAALVLLLIACANLAGLLLVRAIRRSRESAVRLALGASAHVLIRHSLLETLILGLSGGLLGIAIAAISLRLFVRFLPSTLPRIDAIHLDPTVVGFALLLALVTCLLCGAAPAFATIGVNVNSALKAGARSGTVEGGHARLRSILVVAQIAVALVLLTASGLLLRSFQELRDVDLGYPTQNLLIANYSLPSQKYSSQTQVTDFNHDLLERLQRLPGTHAAALTSLLPINGAYGGTVVTPEGYVAPKSTEVNMALPVYIEGPYFQTTGIPLLRGRAFTQDDNEKSQLVVIVNRKLAEHYWHGEDPIGKRLHVGTAADPNPWLTIIGEIPNVTQGGPEETQDHQEQYFQPLAQVNVNPGTKGATHRYHWEHDVRPGPNIPSPSGNGNFHPRGLSLSRPATRREPIAEYEPGHLCHRRSTHLQHSSYEQLCPGSRIAGGAGHVQRHCLLGCVARAGDGDPPGVGFAVLRDHTFDSGLWNETRHHRLRDRFGSGHLSFRPSTFFPVRSESV